MSTTRIVFIIVCVVVAIMVFTLGIIMQKNNPNGKYSVTNVLNPRSSGKRRKVLPKNTNSVLTIFLILLLLFLYIVFSKR